MQLLKRRQDLEASTTNYDNLRDKNESAPGQFGEIPIIGGLGRSLARLEYLVCNGHVQAMRRGSKLAIPSPFSRTF